MIYQCKKQVLLPSASYLSTSGLGTLTGNLNSYIQHLVAQKNRSLVLNLWTETSHYRPTLSSTGGSGEKLSDNPGWARQEGTGKDAQHHSLLEEGKSKPERGCTSHWSEQPSSKRPHTIKVGEGVEKRAPSYPSHRHVRWCSQHGGQCGDSF